MVAMAVELSEHVKFVLLELEYFVELVGKFVNKLVVVLEFE